MDNREFEKVYKPRFKRLEEHLPDTDDLCLITLKGHLLVEEILEEIVLHHCLEPETLNGVDISFFLKLRLAQSLIGSEKSPKFIWEMASALNSLRNELSHNLESEKVDGKLERFLSFYRKNNAEVRNLDKAAELKTVIGYTLGALSFVETSLKTGKIPPKMEVEDV